MKFFSIRSLNLQRCAGWKKPLVVAATGFGLGCSPVASGTVGTLPGILLVLAMALIPLGMRIAAAILCVALSALLCDVAEKHFGVKDDPRIVADECLTFPICMLGLPTCAWMMAVAFLTNRVMDIVKPPPARRLQSLPGGLGITIDDLISSIYSLAINHALYRAILLLIF